MELSDLLDRKLIPKAALSTEKGRPLIGDIVEHPRDFESDDENSVGYLSLPGGRIQPELSPFGRIYYALDQLTTLDTVQFLKSSLENLSLEDAYPMPLASHRERCQRVKVEMSRSLEHIVALFKLDGMLDALNLFLEDLLKTFRCLSSDLDVSERGWIILMLVFMTNTTQLANLQIDERILASEVLGPFGLSMELFNALAGVFDAVRFSDAC